MRKYYCLIFIVFVCLSCSNDQVKTSTKLNLNLKTDADHTAFLEKILEEDQKVRDWKVEDSIVAKHGRDSKEHIAYFETMREKDRNNLDKLNVYFEEYGYPSKERYGNQAAFAPAIVIHHNGLSVRENYFKILYEAYLNEDIEDSILSMYLGRTYRMKYRDEHTMENPYTSESQINSLIQELGYVQQKKEVKHKIEAKSKS